MTIKVTVPNTSSDSLTFGSGNTPTAAQVIGIDSGSSNGQLAFNTTASGTSTERMRIDASGNVGIGTSSPNQKLTIDSASSLEAAITLRANGQSAASELFVGQGTDNTAYIQNRAAKALVFGTSDAERMRIDSSGNLLFNSGYGSVATAYGCRAWVNFNGTGTVAMRASGNVSSITDNGTGLYTVNFATSMPDANYSMGGSALSSNTNTAAVVEPVTLSTSSAAMKTMRGATTTTVNDDANPVCLQFFR
jgi:hypothetical protein